MRLGREERLRPERWGRSYREGKGGAGLTKGGLFQGLGDEVRDRLASGNARERQGPHDVARA